jgi:hypothetical protein
LSALVEYTLQMKHIRVARDLFIGWWFEC